MVRSPLAARPEVGVTMPEQRFASKRDGWLVALVLAPLALPLLLSLPGVSAGRSPSAGISWLLILLLAGVVYSIVRTDYVVSQDRLRVRWGPIRRSRPLSELTRLRASRSIESSPAWSLDRIEVGTTRGFWLLVSPADKAGFVRAVTARAPEVTLDEPLARLLQDV
jgi:hypothetical protein